MAETIAKDNKLRDYELVFIISPDVPDENLDAAVETVSKFITERGGTITQVDRWGKKKMAYSIKSHLEGNYVLTRFKLPPSLSKDLEARLEISDDILRHLLIKLDSQA